MAGLITDFLAQGVAASRPATPDAASGTVSFYFATDTEVLSFYDWNDAAWQNVPLTAGVGDLLAANNLSDVANAATARTNLLPAVATNALKVLRVNAGETDYELATSAGGTASSTTEVLTGTDTTKFNTPDSTAALWEQGSDVASAATVSLGEGGYFVITGTTTITDVDFATDKAGRKAWVKFAGILTLTHNASTLILPGLASITTAAGDTACFVSEGSDVVRCVSYNRAYGNAQWDTFDPTGGGANTGSFGSRGGLVIPENSVRVHALVFRFTADAAVGYDGQIVTLNGSNVVQTIEATSSLGTGQPTTAYGYHIFNLTTPYLLAASTRYGVLCTRNTTAGNSAWTMRGTSASGIMMQAGFLTIDTYLRNTTNTVAVSDTYTSGASSYWFGMRVTPV